MARHARILVVRTDRIGDVVLATPLIRILRARFPSAHIAALVRPYTRDVLVGNPHLDDILTDDPDGENAGTQGFWRQVRALRRHRFDTALLLLPTRRLAWILFFAGIRTRVSVGTRPYQILTAMKLVSRHKYVPLRHEADYCLDLGRAIGAEGEVTHAQVMVSDEEREHARHILESQLGEGWQGERRTLIGIHPGSGKSAPNWRIDRYVELAERLRADERVWIVVTGTADEIDMTRPLRQLSSRVIDLVGKLSLRELIAVVSHLDVVVSASTGTMHIAAGLGVATVSLFCPLASCAPELWGPLGVRSEIILPREGYCQGTCPGNPFYCDFEGGIHTEEVVSRVARVLPGLNPIEPGST